MRIISSHCDSASRTTSCATLQHNKGTSLHGAASIGHLEVAKLLLERGANIEAKDKVSICSVLFQQ